MKAFRTESDFTPRIFVPIWLRKNVKQKAAMRLTSSDDAKKSKVEESKKWPSIPLITTTGMAYNPGCKIE